MLFLIHRLIFNNLKKKLLLGSPIPVLVMKVTQVNRVIWLFSKINQSLIYLSIIVVIDKRPQ